MQQEKVLLLQSDQINVICIIISVFVKYLVQSMTENFTQRKSKQLKERSQSVRNIKAPLKNNDYYPCANNINQLTSKPSKEYNKMDYDMSNQKSSSKVLNDHSDYIKNLYKKYLGKENQIQSEKKPKGDSKIPKNLIKEDKMENHKLSTRLFQEQVPVIIKSSITQQSNPKKEITEHHLTQKIRNKSTLSMEIIRQKKKPNKNSQQEICTQNYKQLLNNELLLSIGDPRNSLIRCLKSINQAKKILK